MIIEPTASPMDVYAGIYRHYKGGLYLVSGYSQNKSEPSQLQIAYTPLYLSNQNLGALNLTRNWQEFFETVCPFHDGVPVYTDDHSDARRTDDIFHTCDPERDWVDRFTYKGPVYLPGMEL